MKGSKREIERKEFAKAFFEEKNAQVVMKLSASMEWPQKTQTT